ncbi:hypothetical protein BMS3Abin17_00767 [archaeon BMS3Abin17]|nr:hypothetical protein BMS3Abin17_00767 [archaeon BMS3Abin17]
MLFIGIHTTQHCDSVRVLGKRVLEISGVSYNIIT